MMTLDEIRLSKINPLIAREAYEHAAARLADALDTKKDFEQKAFALFNGYIAVSLALFGVGGALLKEPAAAYPAAPFIVAGAPFIVGAILFVIALVDSTYGAVASNPDMWLNPGTIDGPDSALPLMLAYITYYHQGRIEESNRSNRRKAHYIRAGIILGISAPFLFLTLFFEPWRWL